MRFFCKALQCIGSGFDHRVQIRCALAEDVHRKRIAFRLVLNPAECVNRVKEHVLVVPEVAVYVRNRHAQSFERICSGSGSVPGGVHILC